MLSFRELLSSFPEDYRNRVLEFIFLKSSKVLNLTQYSSEKEKSLDFSYKKTKKLYSKLINPNYPLTRLTNRVFFYKKKWFLDQGVFSPRVESELLVELVKKWIKELKLSSFSYLDICSGSGVIFLSLMEELKEKINRGISIDSSIIACKNIYKNSSLINNHLKNNIYLTDWVKFLHFDSKWEVITINPPYLSEEEFINNNLLILGDPKWALQAQNNGWSHYERILEFANKNLYWKLIILECSEFHENKWNQVNLKNNCFELHKYKDYLNKFRAVALIRK